MNTFLYLMRSRDTTLSHVKLGHRTAENLKDVLETIEKEYSEYECYYLCDLNVPSCEEAETIISSIRREFAERVGPLATEKPEYYSINSVEAQIIVTNQLFNYLRANQ